MLLYTSNNEIALFIRKLNKGQYPIYDINEIVKKISAWAKSNLVNRETMTKHASVALGFLKEYKEEPSIKSNVKIPSLIYDTDEKLVSYQSSVFLKDRNSDITNPPSYVGIKFMHPVMRSAFEQLLGKNGRNLVSEIQRFGVKEYNTARIIEKMNNLVKRRMANEKIEKAKEYCISGIRWIWRNQHILDKVSEKSWIYVITRDGSIVRSDEIYLGEEYGNEICENLFKGIYENKFIGDIRSYVDTKESTNSNIIKFLESIGVSRFPRKQLKRISIEKQYQLELLGSLGFPFRVEDASFSSLENMINRISENDIEVIVIDELDKILNNIETNHIIRWIRSDLKLEQILYSRKETDVSKVYIKWDAKQIMRSLPIDNILSYTYWKFKEIPWVTVNGSRYSINDCLLSKIGDNLKPALVEPDIKEYVKEIDGNRASVETEYEDVFKRLGVKSDFADLTVKKIYETLHMLPTLDEKGTIASIFYSSLAKSNRVIEDNELTCTEYAVFMKEGKVLCNSGYKDLNDSWYQDSKSFCDKITKSYNLITIPKRYSSKKIMNLLGVKKLEIEGEVVGSSELHPLNKIFQEDFKSFKPLAFCYRINYSTNKEKKQFADLTIILYTEISGRFNDKIIELDNYDFMLKDTKTYYLKTPMDMKTIDNLIQNVKFSAAIANILCSYIDVANTFPSFRELYGVKAASRKELILQIFEDESIIERARFELNYSEDIKDEFRRILKKISGRTKNDVDKYIYNIDFTDLNSTKNAEVIIHCFKELHLDIIDYNRESPSTKIDLYDFFESKLKDLKPRYRDAYKLHCYNNLMTKDIQSKKSFINKFMEYDVFRPKHKYSVYTNIEFELKHQLGLGNDYEVKDLNKVYAENRLILIEELSNIEYLDEFLESNTNSSLLYYGEFETLLNSYDKLAESRIQEADELNEDMELDMDIDIIRIDTKPSIKINTKGYHGIGKTGFSRPRNLDKIGAKGEHLVYRELKKLYSNLIWVSENAKIAGVNPEGKAGYGYDMEYVDGNGKRKYVEVKSSKSKDIIFYLSNMEYNFGISNSDSYEIYYVEDLLGALPRILKLDNIFEEFGINGKKYAFEEKREYKVMANVITK